MRYIYIVAGLILIILGISGITFLKPQPPSSKELARINERVITIDEFRKAYDERASISPVPVDKKLFLEELITKEILLQESKRRGLDLREPFRRSIQNYYEQTLLKNLAHERMSEIKASVDEKEIASYYENMGKVFELRAILLPTEKEAHEAVEKFPSEKAERKILHIDEIPYEIIDDFLSLKAGEVCKRPIPFGTGFLVFRLDGIKREPVPPQSQVRDEIRKIIEDRKRRGEMEKWLEGLRRQSRIKINEVLLKQEG